LQNIALKGIGMIGRKIDWWFGASALKFYVYIIWELPEIGAAIPRYVGKGQGRRFVKHRKMSMKISKWLHRADKIGKDTALTVIMEGQSEWAAKISASHTGKKLSPEHIEKLRLSSTGRKASMETIAKQSARAGERWSRPEYRARQIEAAKKYWNDPEHRASRIAKMKAGWKKRQGNLKDC
jgi:hypothetical protein